MPSARLYCRTRLGVVWTLSCRWHRISSMRFQRVSSDPADVTLYTGASRCDNDCCNSVQQAARPRPDTSLRPDHSVHGRDVTVSRLISCPTTRDHVTLRLSLSCVGRPSAAGCNIPLASYEAPYTEWQMLWLSHSLPLFSPPRRLFFIGVFCYFVSFCFLARLPKILNRFSKIRLEGLEETIGFCW